MNTDVITVSTIVAVDPVTAFAIFTGGIAAWWRPKVPGLFRPGMNGALKFDNNRLIEIRPEAEPFEVGRVLTWDPPTRLAFDWRQEGFGPADLTRVEVTFEALSGGTRVTVRHSGWDALAPGHPTRHGYTGNAFTSMVGLRWADALTSLLAIVKLSPLKVQT
jgi:uncharacterized protein YndB with AHSA1/START domain